MTSRQINKQIGVPANTPFRQLGDKKGAFTLIKYADAPCVQRMHPVLKQFIMGEKEPSQQEWEEIVARCEG